MERSCARPPGSIPSRCVPPSTPESSWSARSGSAIRVDYTVLGTRHVAHVSRTGREAGQIVMGEGTHNALGGMIQPSTSADIQTGAACRDACPAYRIVTEDLTRT